MKLPPFSCIEKYFSINELEYFFMHDPWLGRVLVIYSNHAKYVIPWPKNEKELLTYLQQHYTEVLI